MTLSTPPPASASDATVAVPISYGASQSKLLAIGIGRGRPPGALNSDGSKPKRKRITPEQLEVLTELFEQTDTPSFEIRESLAGRLSMTNREVQVWFQNRRAKMNRLRAQGHPVPASNNPEKAAALAGVQNVQASNSKSGPKFRKVVSPKDGKVARPPPIHHQSPPSELVYSSSYHSFPQPPPHYYSPVPPLAAPPAPNQWTHYPSTSERPPVEQWRPAPMSFPPPPPQPIHHSNTNVWRSNEVRRETQLHDLPPPRHLPISSSSRLDSSIPPPQSQSQSNTVEERRIRLPSLHEIFPPTDARIWGPPTSYAEPSRLSATSTGRHRPTSSFFPPTSPPTAIMQDTSPTSYHFDSPQNSPQSGSGSVLDPRKRRQASSSSPELRDGKFKRQRQSSRSTVFDIMDSRVPAKRTESEMEAAMALISARNGFQSSPTSSGSGQELDHE